MKPGLFQSWRECAWKLSAAVLFAGCVLVLVLAVSGVIQVHAPAKPGTVQF